MHYVNTETGALVTEAIIRASFPDVSFAQPFAPLPPFEPVANTAPPSFNADTHTLQEGDPQPTESGGWQRTWRVVPLTPEQIALRTAAGIAQFDAALVDHFDSVAQSRHYDNRITCALRAGYTGPFKAEGTAFAQWMDACNVYAYQALADWQAGKRQAPASVQAFVAELPTITWPV